MFKPDLKKTNISNNFKQCYSSGAAAAPRSRLTSILRLVLTAILVEALLIGFCEGGDEVIDDMGPHQDPFIYRTFFWGINLHSCCCSPRCKGLIHF